MRLSAALLAALLVVAAVGHGVTAAGPLPVAATADGTTAAVGLDASPPESAAPIQSAPPIESAAPIQSAASEQSTTSAQSIASARNTQRTTARQVIDDDGRPNVSRVLTLPAAAVDARNVTAVTVDAAGATGLGSDVVEVRVATGTLESRLAVTQGEAQRELLGDATERLANETAALERRQAAAIRSYNGGETTTREFLATLARIDRTAASLERRAVLLRNVSRSTFADESPVADNISRTRSSLRRFQGPVRDRIADSVAGRSDEARVFVATTEQGVALSTIDNRTYIREVYRGFLWQSGGTGLNSTEVSNAVSEAYPEIWEARNRTSGTGSADAFVLTVSHPGGRLDAHVRGDNRRVFREVQRLPLSTYPPGPSANRSLNGLVMRVDRTYPGGPLRVNVTDQRTGEPVNTSVAISSIGDPGLVTVGSTGGDGVLWTLGVGGSQQGYTITASEFEGSRVVVVVTGPSSPTTVAGARR